jgi:hypothetical protein
MYVIGAGMARRVNAEAPDKLRVLQLDDLHRQTYHTAVDRGDFPIAVGVYRHIGGVTVLVLAVACRALDPSVMLGRAKSGMHIDFDVGNRLVAVPARDLLDNELQFVQQLRIHGRVARPHSLLVVIQKVTDTQMLGNRDIDVGGRDLEKP